MSRRQLVEVVRIVLMMPWMRLGLVFITGILATTLAPAAGFARNPGGQVDEFVVFGRVKTLSHEALTDDSMDTQVIARLTVTRVVRGRPPSSVLTIKYIAHTDFVENLDFRFHLQRSKDGVWLACGDGGRGYVCR